MTWDASFMVSIKKHIDEELKTADKKYFAVFIVGHSFGGDSAIQAADEISGYIKREWGFKPSVRLYVVDAIDESESGVTTGGAFPVTEGPKDQTAQFVNYYQTYDKINKLGYEITGAKISGASEDTRWNDGVAAYILGKPNEVGHTAIDNVVAPDISKRLLHWLNNPRQMAGQTAGGVPVQPAPW
jgi:hypothetical protein